MTPFLSTVKSCSVKVIKYLIANGSNIHATSIPLLLIFRFINEITLFLMIYLMETPQST